MTLMLHAGAKAIDYATLAQVEPPQPTKTHYPIAHRQVVDLVKHSLTFYGHEIVEESHALTDDGMRYFGLLSLRSPYGQYTDTVGLRNSGDKSFPVGVSFGSRVFVCDNLAFIGDTVIRRKHTQKLRFELPGLIAAIVEALAGKRQEQAKVFELYKQTALTDERADHAILDMYRNGVINVQRIPAVIQQWEKPSFDGFEQRNAWRLFNAATFALAGKVVEEASLTPRLHRVVDAACEPVH